jgi:HlyD family secretion protein
MVELDTAKLMAQVPLARHHGLGPGPSSAGSHAQGGPANLARLEEVHRLSGGKVPSATELDAGRATL